MDNEQELFETPAPVEPAACLRAMSAQLFQLYTALTEQGFTIVQAMELVNTWLANMIAAGASMNGGGEVE